MKNHQFALLYLKPRLVLPGINKIITEFLDNIYYCEADDTYSRLFLKNKENHLTSYGLGKLEQSLAPYHIIRSHRSFMVNLMHVKEINKKKNLAILTNNIEIPISQKYRQNLIETLFQTGIRID